MKKYIVVCLGLVFLCGCGLTSKDTKPTSNTGDKIPLYAASGKGVAFSPDSGASWQHYAKTKTNGLLDEHVNTLAIVDARTFWVGTAHGLAMTTNNAETWTTFTVDNGLPNNEIRIVQRADATLYVGTAGGLAISTDNARSWTAYTSKNGMSGDGVNTLAVNGNTLFVGTDRGLCISTDNARTWVAYTVTKDCGVKDLFQKNDRLYLCTTKGLFVLNNVTTGNYGVYEKIMTDGFEDFLSKECNVFVIDADGGWWLGTNEGLARSNNQGLGWRRYDQSDGIDAYVINDIAVRGLMVFVATEKGLSVSNDGGESWVTYNKDEGLQSLALKQIVLR